MIKLIELKNNISNKIFRYTKEEFEKYFHDEILTICFKLINTGEFIPEKLSEGNLTVPNLELVLSVWDRLSRREMPRSEMPLYLLIKSELR